MHDLTISRSGRLTQPGQALAELAAGAHYRFERLAFSTILADLRFRRSDPGPGRRVPAFDLPTANGGRISSRDLAADGPVLLVFGSNTCPVTDSAAPGLRDLHARFGDRVRFVMVNVREAHPGNRLPQPRTIGEKISRAALLRDQHGFDFAVAVDDLDGTLHRALGPKPNSAYLLGVDGTILFRSHWANDTAALGRALTAVVAGTAPRPSTAGGVLAAMWRMLRDVAPVLDRAGRDAWRDMWRVAAPVAALSLLLRSVGIRPSSGPVLRQG